MLRITKLDANSERANFKVEGRLVSTWVHLLMEECREALQETQQVVLDFTHVSFADETGIHALQTLSQDHRIVLRASEFINHLLRHKRSSP